MRISDWSSDVCSSDLAAGTKLLAGQFITIGDQLIALGDDVVANGSGQATLTLESRLRVTPADNAVGKVEWPTAIMALTGDTAGWSVEPGRIYENVRAAGRERVCQYV